jgi:trehalose 6-phosphate phosphatase
LETPLRDRLKSKLKHFTKAGTLLALDFDGTLAPIVKVRQSAELSERTRELLQQAARIYPTVIITGRSLSDIKKKMKGIHPLILIGNHGAEGGRADSQPIHQVKEWKKRIAGQLRMIEGCDIEDKRYSISIHYRDSKNKAKARREILKLLKGLPNVKVMNGKSLFNVVDARSPGKGQALLSLMKKMKFKKAIFAGDDVTDEDVFRLGNKAVLGIRVGQSRAQSDVNRFLKLLVDLRQTAPND